MNLWKHCKHWFLWSIMFLHFSRNFICDWKIKM